MCSSKASNYLFLVFVLIFLSTVSSSSQTRCAGFSEYCQTHWDCCSNSCHSYLMRCTRGQAIYPYDFFGLNPILPANAVQTTLEEILQINFGAGSHLLDNSINDSTESTTLNSPLTMKDNEIAKKRKQRATDVKNVPMISTEKMQSCNEIGSKCYRDDECCSQRCHGFLHKCVT